MIKNTKFSPSILICCIFWIHSFSFADENYFSLKEGRFSNVDVFLPNGFAYQKDVGTLREVGFNIHTEQIAQNFTGSFNFDNNNKLSGLLIGFITSSGDKILVRNMTMDDIIEYTGDMSSYRTMKIDSQTNEITYISAKGLLLTYGQSNFPIMIDIRKNGTIEDFVIDFKPNTKYVNIGFRLQNIDDIINETTMKNSFQWYGDATMSFGLLYQELSQNIQNSKNDVEKYSIKGDKGYDANLNANFEVGIAYPFQFSGKSGIAGIGLFWDYNLPWISGLANVNTTNTGYDWSLGGRMVYGGLGRIAIKF